MKNFYANLPPLSTRVTHDFIFYISINKYTVCYKYNNYNDIIVSLGEKGRKSDNNPQPNFPFSSVMQGSFEIHRGCIIGCPPSCIRFQ